MVQEVPASQSLPVGEGDKEGRGSSPVLTVSSSPFPFSRRNSVRKESASLQFGGE